MQRVRVRRPSARRLRGDEGEATLEQVRLTLIRAKLVKERKRRS
jgi:hypothetical protein